MAGDEYPILALSPTGARMSDFQMHWPVASSSAHSRPSPPLEVGSGAPKITAVCPATESTMDALEAIPGPDGLPDPTAAEIIRGWFVMPQASGEPGAVTGGYCQRIVA